MQIRRILLLSVVAFGLGVEAAAQSSLAGDGDVDRPGGVYTTLRLADAPTCASLCAADGICLAWTYRADGACELKAVIPAPVASRGARSGLSSRAPAFAHLIAVQAPAERVSTMDNAPAPSISVEHEHVGLDADYALLGGLMDAEEFLRPRLGAAAVR